MNCHETRLKKDKRRKLLCCEVAAKRFECRVVPKNQFSFGKKRKSRR
jgi:hypothetical protein